MLIKPRHNVLPRPLRNLTNVRMRITGVPHDASPDTVDLCALNQYAVVNVAVLLFQMLLEPGLRAAHNDAAVGSGNETGKGVVGRAVDVGIRHERRYFALGDGDAAAEALAGNDVLAVFGQEV